MDGRRYRARIEISVDAIFENYEIARDYQRAESSDVVRARYDSLSNPSSWSALAPSPAPLSLSSSVGFQSRRTRGTTSRVFVRRKHATPEPLNKMGTGCTIRRCPREGMTEPNRDA